MAKNYNQTIQSNNTDLQAILNTINELPEAGGGDPVLQDKTVTPTTSKQTVTADSGYDGLDTVTVNAMPTATQATPAITVNASGLITATATQTAGYVVAGSKSATKQLAFQAAKTITPTTASQVAVSSGYYTGGSVTVAGDSNLVAGNIKSGVSIFGVNGTYVGSGSSSGGGDTDVEDSFVTRTMTSYTNNRVTYIGQYAFCNHTGLTTVSFPAVTTIYYGAFSTCSNLTTVSFPVAKTIGSYAFFGCIRLTTVNFPVATTIGSRVFTGCTTLTTANFPAVTNINSYAFDNCSNLTTVSFPVAKTIGSYAFWNCSNLTTVSFPVATTLYGDTFYSCTKLTSIYLAASRICTLKSSHAFSHTGIWSNKGSIFVPSSLVSSYKTATNWAYFSNRIFAYTFSDSSNDGGGGLPEPPSEPT